MKMPVSVLKSLGKIQIFMATNAVSKFLSLCPFNHFYPATPLQSSIVAVGFTLSRRVFALKPGEHHQKTPWLNLGGKVVPYVDM
jgi:hypothetical protein